MRICPLCTVVPVLALVAVPAALLLGAAPVSQDAKQDAKKEWQVHDKDRPQPTMVTPGGHGSAPSDAVVLFDGKNLDAWTGGQWEVKDGYFQVKPGSGNIRTKEGFGSCQLHIEWMVPESCKCNGQQGCNSGLFFMDRYELQILGSNPNKTYVDGMAGAMYGQYPPLVNACNPNGQWNTYDVIFHAPKFNADGSLAKAGTMTVFFNGILVQDHSEIWGATAHAAKAKYSAHEPKLPIGLQDHGDALCFRNVWLRPLAD
ncbi:MAG: 3-keto-disaccharide hydrolase [Phycisphaerales bacterium]